jgi:hypothetical protein
LHGAPAALIFLFEVVDPPPGRFCSQGREVGCSDGRDFVMTGAAGLTV